MRLDQAHDQHMDKSTGNTTGARSAPISFFRSADLFALLKNCFDDHPILQRIGELLLQRLYQRKMRASFAAPPAGSLPSLIAFTTSSARFSRRLQPGSVPPCGISHTERHTSWAAMHSASVAAKARARIQPDRPAWWFGLSGIDVAAANLHASAAPTPPGLMPSR